MNTERNSTLTGAETSQAQIWVRDMVADGWKFLLRPGADPHDLNAYHIRKDFMFLVVTEDDSHLLLKALAERDLSSSAPVCLQGAA